jgi:hypothetical protein
MPILGQNVLDDMTNALEDVCKSTKYFMIILVEAKKKERIRQ